MLCFELKAQTNLIPNYSFEQYSTCPDIANGNILYATGWLNANVNGTSDYYNACVTTPPYYFWVPSNFPGYQYPKTGNGYGGFYVKTMPHTTGQYEYVQSQLLQILKPNYHYCVQFFVSRADNKGNYGISNFGALFTNTVVNSSDQYNIQMTPQVKNPTGNIIVNRTVWATVSGTFTATGGEQYISIGNFDDPANTDTIYDPIIPGDTLRDPGSIYYYIDDVTVEEVANAQAGLDKIITCGDSVVLGADSAIGAYYKWVPNIGLSNDSIAFPVANPTITTTYVLKKQQCSIITYDTVKVTVNGSCPVGVKELLNERHFKVYPNPAAEQLNVELDLKGSEKGVIYVYNIMGELVISEKIASGKTTVNTATLNNGTYLYKIFINNNVVQTNKLIIMK